MVILSQLGFQAKLLQFQQVHPVQILGDNLHVTVTQSPTHPVT